MSDYLLGIDCGQSATKAAVFDVDGCEVASARVATTVMTPRPRWAERDLDHLWTDTAHVVRRVLAGSGVPADRVGAVGVCGHSDGTYLVDEALRPVRPAVLATDTRAHAISTRIAQGPDASAVLALTGQVPFPASTGAVLAWLQEHEPQALARTRWLLGCKDWVRLQLTDTVGTDRSEASTSFTNVHTQQWSQEALELYGLGHLARRLPPIHDSTDIVGRVGPRAAALTGLLAGTPVVAGAHDVHAAALGIGATGDRAASVVLGTFSINQVLADHPVLDPRWQARSYIHPGRWLHMSSSPAGTVNLDWTLLQLGLAPAVPPDPHHPDAGGALAALAQDPGADDPLFLPFLHGSVHGPDLGAAYVDLRAWHGPDHLVRAVAEGIAFNHRTHLDRLRTAFDPLTTVRVCGGGTRTPAWTQLLADVLDVRIEVTDTDEAGARGAALLAGVGTGTYTDLEDATHRTTRLARTHDPRPEAVSRLETRFARYQDVVARLGSLPSS